MTNILLNWIQDLNVKLGYRVEDLNTEEAKKNIEKLSISSPDPNSQLCTRCWIALVLVINPYNLGKTLEIPDQDHKTHYGQWEQLIQAAKIGCIFCRFVLRKHHFEISFNPRSKDLGQDDRRLTAFSSKNYNFDGKLMCMMNISVYKLSKKQRLQIEMTTTFSIIPVSTFKPNFHFNLEAKSRPEKVAQVQKWIKDCVSTHVGRCSQLSQNARFLPTRLLRLRRREELGNKSTISINLLETASYSGDPPIQNYLTLSHRWGGHQIFKLENAVIESMKQNIDLHTLPRVFQEAIEFTLDLMGEEAWLWIDSLCIIQDSQDWIIEAANMGEVYANSYLNLGATASNGPHGSLWHHPEDASSRLTPAFQILSEGTALATIWPPSPEAIEVDLSLLSHRAWILQERALSSRMLHFGTSQVYWECDGLHVGETYPDGFRRMSEVLVKPFKNIVGNASLTDEIQPSKLLEAWNDFIDRYTHCSISRPSDRLPAMAAIAKAFKQKFKDEYFAGIWKKHLPQGLLWKVTPSKGHSTRSIHDYVAPSWSWASVEGGVEFGKFSEEKYLVATVENIDTVSNPMFPLGAVNAGHIIVRGHLANAYWWMELPDYGYAHLGFYSGSLEEKYGFVGIVPDDCRAASFPGQSTTSVLSRPTNKQLALYKDRLFCFPITVPLDPHGQLVREDDILGERTRGSVKGLILRRSEHVEPSIPNPKNCFQRVGYFQIEEKSCIRHLLASAKTTFTII